MGKKVDFWNPTVANLTLMALGSSAPEILLAVLETVTRLGKCPGELGASTIVGSAAFNLLVISGISIYAVTPENDTDEDRDVEMPIGVKRIKDMRVFAITCTSSFLLYLLTWPIDLPLRPQRTKKMKHHQSLNIAPLISTRISFWSNKVKHQLIKNHLLREIG